jgi:hypothetical protein
MLVRWLSAGVSYPLPGGAYGSPDVPKIADCNRLALSAGMQECSVGA